MMKACLQRGACRVVLRWYCLVRLRHFFFGGGGDLDIWEGGDGDGEGESGGESLSVTMFRSILGYYRSTIGYVPVSNSRFALGQIVNRESTHAADEIVTKNVGIV